MTPVLPDTNILIDVLNGKHERLEYLQTLLADGCTLCTTSIVVTELYVGVRTSEEERTERLLSTLQFFPVKHSTARLAGELIRHWRSKGVTLALPDVTIAAVCIENGLTLLTGNVKHFPMTGLSLLTCDRANPTT